MTRSIRREPVDLGALGATIRAFDIAGFWDLGVWPNLHQYVGKLHNDAP